MPGRSMLTLLVVALLSLIALLAGCGAAPPTASPPLTIQTIAYPKLKVSERLPDSLTVYRTVDFPHQRTDFTHTFTERANVAALYSTVLALPLHDDSHYYCPLSLGLAYHISFLSHGAVVLQIVAQADGCRLLYMTPTPKRGSVSKKNFYSPFWYAFSDLAGIPDHTLWAQATLP